MTARGTATTAREAGIYVHVPFCCSKCRYCAFYSVTAGEAAYDDYVAAVAAEWELVRAEEPDLAREDLRITSIYVGGGTPSILGGDRLARLLGSLRAGPAWADDVEISCEANPESTTPETAAGARAAGYNRISIGVQSFRDDELELLGRAGRTADTRRAIDAVRAAGFANLNLDLIYGLPEQSVERWLESVEAALECGSEHLSCYLLTPEENTILHRLLHGGDVTTPLEETLLQQYRATDSAAAAAGLEHYEISNFARRGFRCRHNEGTWLRRPYYGLGPAAHSFDGHARWQNVADVDAYLHALLREGHRPARERYRLSAEDQVKEMIILGLRLADGLRWADLDAAATPEQRARLRRRAQFLAGSGFTRVDEERLRLAPEACFVSNAVFVELLRALDEETDA